MKPIKILLGLVALALLVVTGCTHKGKPHQQGQLLTKSQVKALADNQSMNGKLVTVEGYASLCGAISSVTVGKKNTMMIYEDGFCEGDKLIDIQMSFDGNTVPLSGEEYRNYASASQNFDNNSIKFITDDYRELPNGKLKFSGILVYNGGDYYLDEVTIHN